jgi:hypothetical protein
VHSQALGARRVPRAARRQRGACQGRGRERATSWPPSADSSTRWRRTGAATGTTATRRSRCSRSARLPGCSRQSRSRTRSSRTSAASSRPPCSPRPRCGIGVRPGAPQGVLARLGRDSLGPGLLRERCLRAQQIARRGHGKRELRAQPGWPQNGRK